MPVKITIRDVPEAVRDALQSRATRRRVSLEDYLRAELERLASKPSVDKWLEEVRTHKAEMTSEVSADSILRHRDADRR
ncbi:MAG: hypothetical protein F4Z08_09820 [Chloroflexi bacterium]|nr:hypothetical protein [Chloroflexota bacterium]